MTAKSQDAKQEKLYLHPLRLLDILRYKKDAWTLR